MKPKSDNLLVKTLEFILHYTLLIFFEMSFIFILTYVAYIVLGLVIKIFNISYELNFLMIYILFLTTRFLVGYFAINVNMIERDKLDD